MLCETSWKDLNINPITLFSEDWLALAAGTEGNYNAMTIAWGHLGAVWERGSHSSRLPTAVCFVRPQRYTKEFMDREPFFTLSRLPKEHRKALGILGPRSGRDGDKIADAGLTPVFAEGTTYFAEADLVFICRKLYQAPLVESGFVDKGLVEFNYNGDYHEMYVGEIVKVLERQRQCAQRASAFLPFGFHRTTLFASQWF